ANTAAARVGEKVPMGWKRSDNSSAFTGWLVQKSVLDDQSLAGRQFQHAVAALAQYSADGEHLIAVKPPAEVVQDDDAAGGDALEKVLNGQFLRLGGVHVDVEEGDFGGRGVREAVRDDAGDDLDVGVRGEALPHLVQ